MRKIDRFDKYMKIKGLNDNKVTIQLGITVGVIGKSRKEGRDLSDKVIEKILNYYTDINRTWLLTGEGEMLTSTQTPLDVPGVEGARNERLDKLITMMDEQMKWQREQMKRQQEQMDQLIKNNEEITATNKKLTEQIIRLSNSGKESIKSIKHSDEVLDQI